MGLEGAVRLRGVHNFRQLIGGEREERNDDEDDSPNERCNHPQNMALSTARAINHEELAKALRREDDGLYGGELRRTTGPHGPHARQPFVQMVDEGRIPRNAVNTDVVVCGGGNAVIGR